MMISFKWRHYKKDIILMLFRWLNSCALSYRDVEELALERGLNVDHSTINRWVIKYAPLLEKTFGVTSDLLVFHVVWIKYMSRSKTDGFICTVLLTKRGKLLISCCPKNEMNRQQGHFLKSKLAQAANP